MTAPIDYASPLTRRPLSAWQRFALIPVYYLGWTIGSAVGCAYLLAVVGDGDSNVLWKSLPLGAVAGAVLAHLARRARWPQVTLAVIGVPATVLTAYAVIDIYRMPRGFLWDFFFKLVLALFGGAIALLLAGATGILLTRRRQLRLPMNNSEKSS